MLKNKILFISILSSLLLVSNCTYWPGASIFLKDNLMKLLNSGNQNNLNMLASLFLLPTAIDTTPGVSINLTSDNSHTATWLDVSGDGISDGIDLFGNGFPNILSLDLDANGQPDSLDTNGDGNPDYFLNTSSRGGVLRTGANGTGNPVFLILGSSNQILGFDTDGDGTPNDTLIASIFVDRTPPLLSVNPAAGIYPTEQEITIQCSDETAPGNIIYTLDGSNPKFNPLKGNVIHPANNKFKISNNGVYTVSTYCRDLGGNESNAVIKIYTIDSNLPTVEIVSQTSKGVSNNAGAISQSITRWKPTKSGTYSLRETSNSCNDGNVLSSGNVVANTEYNFTRVASDFTVEGVYYYRICLTSDTGINAERVFEVYRDDAVPTVSSTPVGGNFGTEPTVSLVCADAGGSGCNGIVYTTNTSGLAPNPVFDPATGVITTGTAFGLSLINMANLSTTSLKFQARDSAGNISLINTQSYSVDTDLATITVNSFSSNVKGTVNPTIAWKSNKIGTYQVRLGGTDCASGVAFVTGAPNSNVVGSAPTAGASRTSVMNKALFAEGDNTVRICFITAYGVESSVTRVIRKDSILPVVSIVSPIGPGPFPSGTQLTLACTDTNGSGCKNIIYDLSSTPYISFLGNGSVSSGTLYTAPITLPDGLVSIGTIANDMALNISTQVSGVMQIGIPDAPSYITALGNGTDVFLEWIPTAGATSYTVYYGTSPGLTSASASISGVLSPTYSMSGLSTNTTYYFRIQSHSTLGTSLLSSNEVSAYTTSIPVGFNVSGSYVDISLSQGANSGGSPAAKIDYKNRKLIVATVNSANASKPYVYICDLDGTNCVHKDVSAGQAGATALNPSLLIDPVNQKLLVAGTNAGNSSNISLFRCDLDGNNCVHSNISGGTGPSNLQTILFDSVYKKIIMVSRISNSQEIAYSRCDLNGTNCLGNFLVTTLPTSTEIARDITATIDPISQKLLIVTRNGANGDRLSLFRCGLLADNCVHSDISASQGVGSGFKPQIQVDVINSKLLVTSLNQALGNVLSLFRCDLDGSNCTHKDISAGFTLGFDRISTVINPANNQLLTVGRDNGTGGARLFRCDLDGANETSVDISTGISFSGYAPSLVIDSLNARIAVATTNWLNSSQLGLFLR
jgi:hypothetical protein